MSRGKLAEKITIVNSGEVFSEWKQSDFRRRRAGIKLLNSGKNSPWLRIFRPTQRKILLKIFFPACLRTFSRSVRLLSPCSHIRRRKITIVTWTFTGHVWLSQNNQLGDAMKAWGQTSTNINKEKYENEIENKLRKHCESHDWIPAGDGIICHGRRSAGGAGCFGR
ncbi:MAG TPA: hypothetical protein VMB22_01745 [Verrucomicrobiae bacterium]|nr:hypothetical protein [Verrucomicrobiae bacterium]